MVSTLTNKPAALSESGASYAAQAIRKHKETVPAHQYSLPGSYQAYRSLGQPHKEWVQRYCNLVEAKAGLKHLVAADNSDVPGYQAQWWREKQEFDDIGRQLDGYPSLAATPQACRLLYRRIDMEDALARARASGGIAHSNASLHSYREEKVESEAVLRALERRLDALKEAPQPASKHGTRDKKSGSAHDRSRDGHKQRKQLRKEIAESRTNIDALNQVIEETQGQLDEQLCRLAPQQLALATLIGKLTAEGIPRHDQDAIAAILRRLDELTDRHDRTTSLLDQGNIPPLIYSNGEVGFSAGPHSTDQLRLLLRQVRAQLDETATFLKAEVEASSRRLKGNGENRRARFIPKMLHYPTSMLPSSYAGSEGFDLPAAGLYAGAAMPTVERFSRAGALRSAEPATVGALADGSDSGSEVSETDSGSDAESDLSSEDDSDIGSDDDSDDDSDTARPVANAPAPDLEPTASQALTRVPGVSEPPASRPAASSLAIEPPPRPAPAASVAAIEPATPKAAPALMGAARLMLMAPPPQVETAPKDTDTRSQALVRAARPSASRSGAAKSTPGKQAAAPKAVEAAPVIEDLLPKESRQSSAYHFGSDQLDWDWQALKVEYRVPPPMAEMPDDAVEVDATKDGKPMGLLSDQAHVDPPPAPVATPAASPSAPEKSAPAPTPTTGAAEASAKPRPQPRTHSRPTATRQHVREPATPLPSMPAPRMPSCHGQLATIYPSFDDLPPVMRGALMHAAMDNAFWTSVWHTDVRGHHPGFFKLYYVVSAQLPAGGVFKLSPDGQPNPLVFRIPPGDPHYYVLEILPPPAPTRPPADFYESVRPAPRNAPPSFGTTNRASPRYIDPDRPNPFDRRPEPPRAADDHLRERFERNREPLRRPKVRVPAFTEDDHVPHAPPRTKSSRSRHAAPPKPGRSHRYARETPRETPRDEYGSTGRRTGRTAPTSDRAESSRAASVPAEEIIDDTPLVIEVAPISFGSQAPMALLGTALPDEARKRVLADALADLKYDRKPIPTDRDSLVTPEKWYDEIEKMLKEPAEMSRTEFKDAKATMARAKDIVDSLMAKGLDLGKTNDLFDELSYLWNNSSASSERRPPGFAAAFDALLDRHVERHAQAHRAEFERLDQAGRDALREQLRSDLAANETMVFKDYLRLKYEKVFSIPIDHPALQQMIGRIRIKLNSYLSELAAKAITDSGAFKSYDGAQRSLLRSHLALQLPGGVTEAAVNQIPGLRALFDARRDQKLAELAAASPELVDTPEKRAAQRANLSKALMGAEGKDLHQRFMLDGEFGAALRPVHAQMSVQSWAWTVAALEQQLKENP